MKKPALTLLALISVASAASMASGKDKAKVAAHAPSFAQAACGDCHAVEAPWISPNPEAPTFASIANREGLTQQTLATFLSDAHNYPEAMDFDLDKPQVDELAAYIVTLKDKDYKPPVN